MSLNKIFVNNTEVVSVDNEPTINSENIVKSKGVAKTNFSMFGKKLDFKKTEDGWSLVVEHNQTCIAFNNRYKLLNAVELPLIIRTVNCILVANIDTGDVSTKVSGQLDSSEVYLGSYYINSSDSDISIDPLFEYTKNGLPFGIHIPKEPKPFSIFGAPINFIKNSDGWKLITVSGDNIACFDNGTYTRIVAGEIQLIVAAVSILILNTTTGIISTSNASSALADDEILIGSYYLNSSNSSLAIMQAYFEYKIDGSFVNTPKEYKCFGARVNFVKNEDKWYLSIASNSLILISSDGKEITIPETELELVVATKCIIVINLSTKIISTRSISFVDLNTEHLLCSYYIENANYVPNIQNPTFEYCINGKAFNILMPQKPFSLWGKKPAFVKTSSGWALVIENNQTCIAFDNAYKLIPSTILLLTVGTLNSILVANKNTGAITTRSAGEVSDNEIYLGSYFLPNVNSDLSISPLFEYTKNGILFGMNEITFFGGRPNFVHSENGWDLVISNGLLGVCLLSKNTHIIIPETTLHLTAGTISNIVLNTDTGQLSTQPNTLDIDGSTGVVIASYFFLNDSSEVINIHPLFEYCINGLPFGISTGDSDEVELEPVIPNDIFISDDMPTPIFKKSLRKNPSRTTDLTIVATTSIGGRLRTYEIGEPTNLLYNEVGNSMRFTIEQRNSANKNIFKDIKVHKTNISSKSGATPKILMIGDSITHGNSSIPASPIVKMNELLPLWYNITPSMIGSFAPRGVTGEGRGFFSFEAMVGIENYPYGEPYGFESYGQTLYDAGTTPVTTQFQNPFTFPATSSDLTNHPDWCFTNKKNYPDEPDGLSYEDADATEKANYHFFIFNFAKYMELWRNSAGYNDGVYIPDIITIALGTNDWQPGGIIDSERIVFAMRIAYEQIRAVLPNVKIGIVTALNIAMTLQGFWSQEIYKTILALQELIDELNEDGDSNIFEIPIYACGCRWTAYDADSRKVSEPTDLTIGNNVQQQTISTDVHVLDGIGSDGYWQYMNALITFLVNVI